MALKLGDLFPDFAAPAFPENIDSFHKFIDGKWTILFSHPADFTPVCTTELARVYQLAEEFSNRNVRLVALSCDSVQSHEAWAKDIVHFASSGSSIDNALPFPIIADEKRVLAEKLGMIDPEERDAAGLPLTARAVFVIGPDCHLKLSILYPASVGRNFNEILRVVDALQLTARVPVATPVDWKPGQACMIVPTLSVADTKKHFGDDITQHEVPSGKSYLRTTSHPQ